MKTDEKTIEYVVIDQEIQWAKGETKVLTAGGQEMDIRYEGAVNNGEAVEFQVGDLGLLSKTIAKVIGGNPSSPRIIKLGEFYEVVSADTPDASYKGGITPLELIARGEETDYILRAKISLPQKKED